MILCKRMECFFCLSLASSHYIFFLLLNNFKTRSYNSHFRFIQILFKGRIISIELQPYLL